MRGIVERATAVDAREKNSPVARRGEPANVNQGAEGHSVGVAAVNAEHVTAELLDLRKRARRVAGDHSHSPGEALLEEIE